jgi:uncharacterized GH25 family protein
MMLRRRGAGAATAALALLVTSAWAHDFWIEASSFAPKVGELVKVRTLVGQNLEGASLPRMEARVERFGAVTVSGEAPVLGMDGRDPAGLLRAGSAGGLVVAYRSDRSPIELPGGEFEAYLDLEGLDGPKAARAKAGNTGVPGREVYSRCAKALLAVGGIAGGPMTRPVGLTLELVPETDPYALAPGRSLVVRVLYEGKPLAGALVMALDAASAHEPQRVRSGPDGRASFALPRAGSWLVKTVHMIPAPAGTGADWESFWASLTFALPAAR